MGRDPQGQVLSEAVAIMQMRDCDLSLLTALQTLWPPSCSHPTKLTPTFILCTQSSFYPKCSFCQLFARLSSHHSVFSSYIAFSERYSLSSLVEMPPVPDHSLIYQSIFLIFYRSHYYLKCSLVSICSFSFSSTRVQATLSVECCCS